jgi:hypothetical protein
MMLEPYEIGEKIGAAIGAGVNRLLIGIGMVLTSATLFAVLTIIAAQSGHIAARNASILTLAFTILGYSLQLRQQTAAIQRVMLMAIGASWAAGLTAIILIVVGG